MKQEATVRPERAKRYLLTVDVIVLILGILGLMQIYYKAALPLELKLVDDKLVLTADAVSNDGKVFPKGSVLLTVGGISVKSFEDLEFSCDGLQAGSVVPVHLIANNQPVRVALQLTRFYGWFYLLVAGSLALVVFSVGVIVLLKRPVDDIAALTFHWMMISAFAMITMTWGSYIYPAQWAGVLNRIIFSASYAIVPFFFLWFTFVFPKEKIRNTSVIIAALAPIPLILSVGMGVTTHHALTERSIVWFNRYEIWFDACRAYFALSVIAGVVNFIHTYRKSADESERKKLKWIFFGTVAGPLSFILFWQIPQLFTSEGLIPEEFILIFIAILPLTYGFSIVKYHIFDIDQIFRRSTIYGLSLLAVLGIYVMIIGGASVLIGRLTVVNSVVLSAVASVVTALVFQPLRDRVRGFVDRRFFLVRFNFADAQHSIAARLENANSLKLASDILLTEIQRFIPVKYCGMYILNTHLPESGNLFNNSDEKDLDNRLVSFVSEKLTNNTQFLPLLKESDKETSGLCQRLLISENDLKFIHALIPFTDGDKKIIACLILGQKQSEFLFTSEELSLFSFAGNQFAMAVERFELEYNLRFEKELSSKLKELNELKSFFVSSVSHDLKTPLTSIRMFAEILQEGKSSEEERLRYLRIIEGETDRLTRLINSVLDFARIEKGIKDYSLTECNLITLVKSVMLTMQYQLQMNAFQTEEFYESFDAMVMADKDALTEAFVNIIANAIRYSDMIKFLKVSVVREGEYITVLFADKGVGIPADKRDEIFEPYKRLSNPLTKSSGGMGIGLAIVKHIADVHKAHVEAVPNEYGGSTIRFSLPHIIVNNNDTGIVYET